jgi:hypothetical protein
VRLAQRRAGGCGDGRWAWSGWAGGARRWLGSQKSQRRNARRTAICLRKEQRRALAGSARRLPDGADFPTATSPGRGSRASTTSCHTARNGRRPALRVSRRRPRFMTFRRRATCRTLRSRRRRLDDSHLAVGAQPGRNVRELQQLCSALRRVVVLISRGVRLRVPGVHAPSRPRSSARPVQYCRHYPAVLPRLALQTPGRLGAASVRATQSASGEAWLDRGWIAIAA